MSKNATTFVTTALLVVAGCAPVQVRTYDGPARPVNEVALVKCSPYIEVKAVDGNTSHQVSAGKGMFYTGCEISLLPGKHTVDVCYSYSGGSRPVMGGTVTTTITCGKDIPLTLDAKAGRTYCIGISLAFLGSGTRVWIEDVTAIEQAKNATAAQGTKATGCLGR